MERGGLRGPSPQYGSVPTEPLSVESARERGIAAMPGRGELALSIPTGSHSLSGFAATTLASLRRRISDSEGGGASINATEEGGDARLRDAERALGARFVEYFGVGVGLHFKQLKFLAIVFALLTALSLPALALALAGYARTREAKAFANWYAALATFAYVPGRAYTHAELSAGAWGQGALFTLVGWCDAAGVLLFLGACAHLRGAQARESAALDDVLITPDDYTVIVRAARGGGCLLYTSPSPRDGLLSRMPSSA